MAYTGRAAGRAQSVQRLSDPVEISLTGDANGSISIDGSQDVELPVVVADDSHNHVISNVDGLQDALDGKVDDTQVLTNVPADAVFTDTVYTLPAATSSTLGGITASLSGTTLTITF